MTSPKGPDKEHKCCCSLPRPAWEDTSTAHLCKTCEGVIPKPPAQVGGEWTVPRYVIEDSGKYQPHVEMWTVVLKSAYDAVVKSLRGVHCASFEEHGIRCESFDEQIAQLRAELNLAQEHPCDRCKEQLTAANNKIASLEQKLEIGHAQFEVGKDAVMELAVARAEIARLIEVCKDLNREKNSTFSQSCINKAEGNAALAKLHASEAVVSSSEAKLKEVEHEVERLKQHRAHTRCPQCGNEGVYSNGITLLDSRDQALERVAELEGELESSRADYQDLGKQMAGDGERIASLEKALEKIATDANLPSDFDKTAHVVMLASITKFAREALAKGKK